MSTSIYNIQNWANNTSYKKFDIVYANSLYYYAKEDHTSHPSHTFSETIAANPSLWAGNSIDPYNGVLKPDFFWTPSYNSEVNVIPRVKVIKYGDGYEQRIQDGINATLLEVTLNFEDRRISETTSIVHFLTEKQSSKYFLFTPAPPYNTKKRFICRSWTHANPFYDKYIIKAKFEEVPA